MAIYEIGSDKLSAASDLTFDSAGVYERQDLQRLLRIQVEVISPDTMVIAEEFGQWDDSKRRIDLLGIDRDANLVVIELKRSESGAHMELQGSPLRGHGVHHDLRTSGTRARAIPSRDGPI